MVSLTPCDFDAGSGDAFGAGEPQGCSVLLGALSRGHIVVVYLILSSFDCGHFVQVGGLPGFLCWKGLFFPLMTMN